MAVAAVDVGTAGVVAAEAAAAAGVLAALASILHVTSFFVFLFLSF
jgi:hypothetical protein